MKKMSMSMSMKMPSNRISRSVLPSSITTYALYSQPYLDAYNQCYRNIITINLFPQGPLASLVQQTTFYPLSEFQAFPGACDTRKQCGFALRSLDSLHCGGVGNNWMSVEELPDLYSFILSHGYTIDTSLTKMTYQSSIVLNNSQNNAKLICFITYHKN